MREKKQEGVKNGNFSIRDGRRNVLELLAAFLAPEARLVEDTFFSLDLFHLIHVLPTNLALRNVILIPLMVAAEVEVDENRKRERRMC